MHRVFMCTPHTQTHLRKVLTTSQPIYTNLMIRMVNTTSSPQFLHSGTCIGSLSPVNVVDDACAGEDANDSRATVSEESADTPQAPSANGADVVTPLFDKLPDDMTVSQRQQVENLLHDYDDIFSKGPYDMGHTSLVEHSIDSGDSRPIRQGLRPSPAAHLDIIDQQIDEMMRHDLVEPAASPWSSYVVMVRKKDGSFRLCVDYRALSFASSRHLSGFDEWRDMVLDIRSPFGIP